MKPQKLFLILSFILFSTNNIFAQNEMKARIEYEDAEMAFQNKEYERAITHLDNAEKLLGKWTAKVSYLKIQALDIVTDYSVWSDNTSELNRQIVEYLNYADKNPDKVDIDRMRELYDIEKSINYLQKAKDWTAMPEFKDGLNAFNDKKYEEAMDGFKKAANKGNVKGMEFIGYLYYEGMGVSQNYKEAIHWFQKSADEGSSYAMNKLGDIYYYAKDGSRDLSKAINWFQKAANKGNSDAMYSLGLAHRYEGQGVSKDYAIAMNWFQKAANKGNPEAMYEIGNLYQNGFGVMKNYTEAMNWYQKSAKYSNIFAINAIGSLYYLGKGVAKNYQEALDRFLIVLEKGNLKSFRVDFITDRVADCYYNLKQYEKAVEWYNKVYEIGSRELKITAKNRIAYIYEEGLGVEKDKKKAKEWRSK